MRPEFPAYYGFMIPFREQHPALFRGATVWVHNSDETHVVSYLRRTVEEEFLIVVNLSNSPFAGTVEVAGRWEEIPIPLARVHHNTGQPDQREADAPEVALPALALGATGFRIFHRSLSPTPTGRQEN